MNILYIGMLNKSIARWTDQTKTVSRKDAQLNRSIRYAVHGHHHRPCPSVTAPREQCHSDQRSRVSLLFHMSHI